jgi:hypothetical protein
MDPVADPRTLVDGEIAAPDLALSVLASGRSRGREILIHFYARVPIGVELIEYFTNACNQHFSVRIVAALIECRSRVLGCAIPFGARQTSISVGIASGIDRTYRFVLLSAGNVGTRTQKGGRQKRCCKFVSARHRVILVSVAL